MVFIGVGLVIVGHDWMLDTAYWMLVEAKLRSRRRDCWFLVMTKLLTFSSSHPLPG